MSSGEIVGQVLDGKYSIERRLGKGGMGTVYLATHIGTGRPVAVKVIAPDFMRKTEFVERFRREARAAGRLRHPNVVDVTDFGFCSTDHADEVAYLVMEYLDGCTLGEILDEEKQLPLAWTIDIMEQVCSAVAEAHNQGIIHRDLKPDNIWLEPNQRGGYTVKVLDFGIAKLEEAQTVDPSVAGIDTDGDGEVRPEAAETVAESRGSETIAAESSTLVAEGDTVSLPLESGTLVSHGSEAGTIIQESGERRVDKSSEDGTVLLPDAETSVDADPGRGETDSLSRDPSTSGSLMGSPSTRALTRIGAVLGTPLYMSPEQCRGEKLTNRSDIYSLAVIVYQMLSGSLPFEGDFRTVMDGHKNEVPPPIKAKRIPRRLRRTVMQSLAKDPVDRPESAEAFSNQIKANSEGIGSLMKRALVIYSEYLPKLLLLTILTFLPLVLLTFARVFVNFLRTYEVIQSDATFELASTGIAIFSFFLQVASGALLIGMTTWIIAQVLAYPLRPLNLWAAFREAKSKFKSLAGTVTVSALLSIFAYLFLILPGIYLSARFMLIAPSIMMEGVRGRAAFKRSWQLSKRSFWTVFVTALVMFFVPILLAGALAFSIASILGNIDKSIEITRMREEGVPSAAERKKQQEASGKSEEEEGGGISFSLNNKKFEVRESDSEDAGMGRRLQMALQEGIFELVWTPIALLIQSFASVLSALIYFKTRQAGGESMQELLGKLDNASCPQSKWQQRVQQRLIQSGKVTADPSGNAG